MSICRDRYAKYARVVCVRMLMVIEMIFRFMFQLYDECIILSFSRMKIVPFSEEDEAEV